MSRIIVIGHINEDLAVRQHGPLSTGTRITGDFIPRLGGGGANTAVALSMAGHHVLLVSDVGDGPDSKRLLDELASKGVDLNLVLRKPGPPRRALLLLDQKGERTIVTERSEEDPMPLRDRLVDVPASCLYARTFQSGMTGLLKERLHQGLVVAALARDIDRPRPAHILLASADDLPDVGHDELIAATRRAGGPELRWLVVTRGDQGAEAMNESERVAVPAPRAEVKDTTGAGDVFAAGLIHSLLRSNDIEAALTTGCAWASHAVTADSSIPPDTLRNLLDSD